MSLLDLGLAVRAGDDGALVHVVVAADVVPDVVVLQAGEEGVLHVRVGVRVAGERRILVVLGHEGLVGEHEGMLRAAGVLVEPAADPGLLIGDGVAVVVAGGGATSLLGVTQGSMMTKRALLPAGP